VVHGRQRDTGVLRLGGQLLLARISVHKAHLTETVS
jgi:hypothetical protein